MKEKLWTRQYVLTIVLLMCCHMGPFLLLSVISIFAKQLTGSDTYAGMMTSVFAMTGLLARFVSAEALERVSVKRITILSAGILAAASLGYLFVDNYWLAFILRGFQGLGFGIAVTAVNTYVVRIVPPTRLLEGIGYSSLTNSLGQVVGPTIAFAILGEKYDHFLLLFCVVFTFTAVTFLLSFLLQNVDMVQKSKTEKEAGTEVIRWSLVILPVVICFFCNIANCSAVSFLSLYAIDREIGGIGAYFTINAIGVLASRFVMKKIVDKLGDCHSITICSVCIAVCIYLISVTDALWQILILAFPLGFAMGFIAPVINTYIVTVLPEKKSGLANALFLAAADVAFMVGPVIFGYIAEYTSYAFIFKISGYAGGLSVLFAGILTLKNRGKIEAE